MITVSAFKSGDDPAIGRKINVSTKNVDTFKNYVVSWKDEGMRKSLILRFFTKRNDVSHYFDIDYLVLPDEVRKLVDKEEEKRLEHRFKSAYEKGYIVEKITGAKLKNGILNATICFTQDQPDDAKLQNEVIRYECLTEDLKAMFEERWTQQGKKKKRNITKRKAALHASSVVNKIYYWRREMQVTLSGIAMEEDSRKKRKHVLKYYKTRTQDREVRYKMNKVWCCPVCEVQLSEKSRSKHENCEIPEKLKNLDISNGSMWFCFKCEKSWPSKAPSPCKCERSKPEKRRKLQRKKICHQSTQTNETTWENFNNVMSYMPKLLEQVTCASAKTHNTFDDMIQVMERGKRWVMVMKKHLPEVLQVFHEAKHVYAMEVETRQTDATKKGGEKRKTSATQGTSSITKRMKIGKE